MLLTLGLCLPLRIARVPLNMLIWLIDTLMLMLTFPGEHKFWPETRHVIMHHWWGAYHW